MHCVFTVIKTHVIWSVFFQFREKSACVLFGTQSMVNILRYLGFIKPTPSVLAGPWIVCYVRCFFHQCWSHDGSYSHLHRCHVVSDSSLIYNYTRSVHQFPTSNLIMDWHSNHIFLDLLLFVFNSTSRKFKKNI